MSRLIAILARAGVLSALPILDAASQAATVTASVSATPVKPLTLTKVQDLDLGSVTLGPGTWTGATVSLSRTGTFTCTNANLVCSGVATVAKYNVQGSNQMTVHVSAPNVTLVNQNDPSQKLVLVTDAPATLVLANSGSPGTTFSIGGSITLTSATTAGTYIGTFNVTVDY